MIAFADPPPPVEAEPVIQPGRTIEELTQTVSASRLSTWLQCRLKFHMRYVAGISKPPTAALHVPVMCGLFHFNHKQKEYYESHHPSHCGTQARPCGSGQDHHQTPDAARIGLHPG